MFEPRQKIKVIQVDCQMLSALGSGETSTSFTLLSFKHLNKSGVSLLYVVSLIFDLNVNKSARHFSGFD